MKKQVLAILLTFVIIASAFGAMGLSATKVSAAGESLTLITSSSSLDAYDGYYIWGYLHDSAGNPLANKPIDIFYHFPNEGWQFSNTVYTDANGLYGIYTSSSQSITLKTGYKVGSVYVASSNIVTVKVRPLTKLTLFTSNAHPAPGQQYTLSGRLTDNAGKGLANEPIQIGYRFLGDYNGHYSNTVYTGADGTYSTTTSSSKSAEIYTNFPGDSVYGHSSPYPFVYIYSSTTTLSLATSVDTTYSDTHYTLSGRLIDNAGNGVANKPIDIWYHFDGDPTFHFSNTIYTNANGYYSSSVISSQTVYLQTRFPGQAPYGASNSNVVTVTVLRHGTTLTLYATNTNPPAGSLYTLYGSLKDSGTGAGVAHKPIEIYYNYGDGPLNYWKTVYTLGDGTYSTTVVTSSQEVFYITRFMHDSNYGGASSMFVLITPA